MEHSNERIEELVAEIICFLKKWGLWVNTEIYACGRRYESVNTVETFRGLFDVEVTESGDLPDVDDMFYIDRHNHIAVIREIPLCDIFGEGALRTDPTLISGEAWDCIIDHSTVAADALANWDGNAKKLLTDMISADKIDTRISLWDPLDYDHFEEYETMEADWDGGEEAIPVSTLFDNYDEYLDFMNGNLTLMKNSPILWDMFKELVKDHAMNGYIIETDDELTGEFIDYMKKELDAILRKYGEEFIF